MQSVPGDTPDCLCALNSVGAISLLFLKPCFLSSQLNDIYQAESVVSEQSTRHELQNQIEACVCAHPDFSHQREVSVAATSYRSKPYRDVPERTPAITGKKGECIWRI